MPRRSDCMELPFRSMGRNEHQMKDNLKKPWCIVKKLKEVNYAKRQVFSVTQKFTFFRFVPVV